MFQSDLFPAGEQQSSVPWAYAVGTRIAGLLASGRRLTRADISGLFAEETGALDWGSAWTIDDYNNAVEIGALLWLRESSRIDLVEEQRSVLDAAPKSKGTIACGRFEERVLRAASCGLRHQPGQHWRGRELLELDLCFAAHMPRRKGSLEPVEPHFGFMHVRRQIDP